MDIKKPPRKIFLPSKAPLNRPVPPPLTFEFERRPEPAGRKILKIILWSLAILLLATLIYGAFFFFQINRLGKKFDTSHNSSLSILSTLSQVAKEDFPALQGEKEGRINVLLLGIAGEKKPGRNLTDTIILMSVDTKNKKVALLSLPRDLLVKVPGGGNMSKINSVYQIGLSENSEFSEPGIDLIKKTVSEITNLPIHYYVVLNFDGFERIVDAIGGVNIINERDILDTRYPGPNYSYETFELKKGFHHLDGKTALKYVRLRHGDPEGDFGRAKRQQQVMQAIKNRIFSASTWLNVFALNDLFRALGENIKTDIPPNDFGAILNLAQKLDTQNVNTFVVDAWKPNSLLRATHVDFGGIRAFVLIPRSGNWSEIREVSEDIFELKKIQRKREEIAKESPLIYLVNSSGDALAGTKVEKILAESFGHKNIRLLSSSGNILEGSLVFDLAENPKPFTLDEMINNLKIALSEDNTLAEKFLVREKLLPDFLILIGKDLENVYNMNDVSFDEWQKAQDKEEEEFLKAKN